MFGDSSDTVVLMGNSVNDCPVSNNPIAMNYVHNCDVFLKLLFRIPINMFEYKLRRNIHRNGSLSRRTVRFFIFKIHGQFI